MRRTHVLRVLPQREQDRVLRSLSDRTAAVWNVAQYRCRQAFFAGQRIPSYAALCREFGGHPAYTALPSDIAQETLKKARKAWGSFFALRRLHAAGKVERRPHPPRYWKDRRTGRREALAHEIAHRLRRIGVAEVVIEELTGIREDMDFGHRVNLLVHGFWVFATLRHALEATLVREHIRVVAIGPRGSSSRCHRCAGPVRRPVRRQVCCGACGATWHADANAAQNLLGLPPSNGDGAEAAPVPAALRWNRHRWVLAGTKSARPTRPATRVA